MAFTPGIKMWDDEERDGEIYVDYCPNSQLSIGRGFYTADYIDVDYSLQITSRTMTTYDSLWDALTSMIEEAKKADDR